MRIYRHKVDQSMAEMPRHDPGNKCREQRAKVFRKTYPKKYVEYAEAEPESMQFDQTMATDKVKQEAAAKEFINRNRHRMWMFHVGFVKASHRNVLRQMLESNNFSGMMDELSLKERKLDRGSGSALVTACLSMPKKFTKQDFKNDMWLTTPQRTAREEKMNRMYGATRGGRVVEFNRTSCFKGF